MFITRKLPLLMYNRSTFSSIICNLLHGPSKYIKDIIYLVNETNLLHDLFSVYSVNFIFNFYMFRTSPVPSSGGTTVFMRHSATVWYAVCKCTA
jgi:hypothetical protein